MAKLTRHTFIAIVFAAAGCSSDDLEQSKIDYSCPRLVVLAEASTATVFTAGAPSAPENRIYEARISNTSAKCETQRGLIVANIGLQFKIDAGPAPAPGPMLLQYFLAATEIDTRVIGKEVRSMNVTFPLGVPAIQTEAYVEGVQIPLAQGHTSRNYEIIVGFQLTPEQAQYNRARRP